MSGHRDPAALSDAMATATRQHDVDSEESRDAVATTAQDSTPILHGHDTAKAVATTSPSSIELREQNTGHIHGEAASGSRPAISPPWESPSDLLVAYRALQDENRDLEDKYQELESTWRVGIYGRQSLYDRYKAPKVAIENLEEDEIALIQERATLRNELDALHRHNLDSAEPLVQHYARPRDVETLAGEKGKRLTHAQRFSDEGDDLPVPVRVGKGRSMVLPALRSRDEHLDSGQMRSITGGQLEADVDSEPDLPDWEWERHWNLGGSSDRSTLASAQLTDGPTQTGGQKRFTTGCANCIQRRVKCDGMRPECSQCRQSGKTCVKSDGQQQMSLPYAEVLDLFRSNRQSNELPPPKVEQPTRVQSKGIRWEEPPLIPSFVSRASYWKTMAERYNFDVDLDIVDPECHEVLHEILRYHILQNSELQFGMKSNQRLGSDSGENNLQVRQGFRAPI
ncbi:uncharacterized protein PgNI_12464 [Pyricularia grisea]|uniref:Zn(2)-C6 fungal-type domain-containing protein n=1 Tax=Pyricularia grisea TaxID=148305 RepID=A0A6P8AMK5_PYRGI|nr:uncharacterized protein PgNI_12464 [Pyricularia grisea]TLD03268.1 hypothetical protein PgNI_12464 [Pyricularia grisea]